MNAICPWKVSCENLDLKYSRRPFFRLFSIVYASSRKRAIRVAKYMFAEPFYGNFRANRLRLENLDELTPL
jgi:hypothetical protein